VTTGQFELLADKLCYPWFHQVMKPVLLYVAFAIATALTGQAVAGDKKLPPGDLAVAARAINTLGLEILRAGTTPDRNAVLSPYSIQHRPSGACLFLGRVIDPR
jgi:hypothetical protein